MKNSKTKGALIMSVVSMLLCVAMLMGSTLAWFTDSASTGVNKIQAGNLDIEIVDMGENPISNLGWQTADKRAQDQILWEPGATYKLEPFKIKNKGSLALKYKFIIEGLSGSNKLLEAIEFTYKDDSGNVFDVEDEHTLNAGDASAPIILTGHMKEEAGNEYQGLNISGIKITVVATQNTVEHDSFGNNYDVLALYDKGTQTFSVSTASQLRAAGSVAKPGDTIRIMQDIPDAQRVDILERNVTVDGMGHTITYGGTSAAFVFGSSTGGKWCQNITVKNMNLVGTNPKGWGMQFTGGTSSVLENVNVSGVFELAVNFYGTHGAILNNCNISNSATEKYANSSVFANQQSANQLILNNTTIDDLYINVNNNDASTLDNNGVKLVVNSGSTVGTLYLPTGTTLVPYQVNGGTIGNFATID